MKPAFALDFRNDAITLLHRSLGGWHQVGRVTFDDPDLPAALSYLRATALGLSPRGLATKLILPDDQILWTTVDAPGPDQAAQIRAALVGRTPYAVEDLIFDWEEVDGQMRVAVVARETLAEAEGFAAEHRFNPVAFVAAPAAGYDSEPWFGLTAQAASLLSPGETVEPDGVKVVVADRNAAPEEAAPETGESLAEEVAPEEVMAEAADVSQPAEVWPETAVAPVEAAVAAFDPSPYQPEAFQPEPPPPYQPELFQPEPVQPAPIEVENAAPEGAAAQADIAEAVPAFAAEPYDPEGHDPEPDHLQPAPLPDAVPPVAPRDTPIFGLADDEPPPSAAFRPRGQPDAALPAALRPEPAFDDLPADLAAALQDIVLHDEAPMAVDVEADETPASPPPQPRVDDPAIPDDIPPVPGYSPAMGFASRRASPEAGQAPRGTEAPARPLVARPTAAKPLVAPPPAPRAERPAVNRPTAAAPVVPKESKGGLKGLGAFVTAPGLPGTRKKKAMVPEPAAPVSPAAAAASATNAPIAPAPAATAPAKPGVRSLGARPAPVRGKPRYLGLMLTMLLLLILAVIAAWSTSLAFRSDGAEEVEQAAEDLPAAEDEMLADGQDPEATGDGAEAPKTEVASADIEPEAAADTPAETAPPAQAEDPAGVAAAPEGAATGGDEIFLATSDQVPDTPEPLDVPEVSAQGDPLPTAQAPPPPFGTVYQFDANGLIVPTPEGIITPEGVRLVAGKPPVVPKPRPEGLAPPAADPAATTPPATEDSGALEGEGFVSDPKLAAFRPKARPAELAAAAAAPAADDALPVADSRLAGKRPQARPAAVLAAGEAALAASNAAAASLAAQAEAQAEAKAAEEAAAAPASPMAVAISRRPEARPRDLSRAVEAAVAAAVRAPDPKPEPEEETQLAAAQPAKSPEPRAKPEEKAEKNAASKAAIPRGRDGNTEAEADDEPEVEAAPRGGSTGSVAKQATFKNALALDKTALIGVYGTPSKRYAMVRMSNGRYKKVKVGDSIDGGRIQAITASEVRYQKGSRLVTLSLPKG